MKKIVVHYKNGYGIKWTREFWDPEEYLEWKRKSPELWNKKNETYLELILITSKWIPLEWAEKRERNNL